MKLQKNQDGYQVIKFIQGILKLVHHTSTPACSRTNRRLELFFLSLVSLRDKTSVKPPSVYVSEVTCNVAISSLGEASPFFSSECFFSTYDVVNPSLVWNGLISESQINGGKIDFTLKAKHARHTTNTLAIWRTGLAIHSFNVSCPTCRPRLLS